MIRGALLKEASLIKREWTYSALSMQSIFADAFRETVLVLIIKLYFGALPAQLGLTSMS